MTMQKISPTAQLPEKQPESRPTIAQPDRWGKHSDGQRYFRLLPDFNLLELWLAVG
jgi:hypothetical protein